MIEIDNSLVGHSLPVNIKELLRKLISFIDEGKEVAERQIEATKVEKYAPDWIDLKTPETVPKFRSVRNPFLEDVVVRRDGVTVGFILIWCEDGRLSALEQAWVSDDLPKDWPSPDNVYHEVIPRV